MSVDRSDKDIGLLRSASDLEGQTSTRRPSAVTADTDHESSRQSTTRRQRWRRRVRSIPGVSRSARILRWIIGPSDPIPDSSIPNPQPSLSVSLTLGSRSWSACPDISLRKFNRKLRLHYALYPFLALWFVMFFMLVRQQYYLPNAPAIIDCTASVWDDWPPDVCGLNGTDCEGYLSEGTYRCMGECLDVKLGNPRWIGGESVNQLPLVIGGENGTYRADSWVCPSAIHSGLISARYGGCITLQPLPFGTRTSYIGGKSNAVWAASFLPSTYTGGYTFSSHSNTGCLDLHIPISTSNAICLFLVTIFFSPPSSVLFSILVILGYFQITLVSNPASQPPDWEYILGGLPAVMFASYWAWRLSFRRTMLGFRDLPLELGLWQGAGFWLGVESSTIFSVLPTLRLGYDSINGGGLIFIIVIIILALIVVLIQAWQMRKYGLLQYYIIHYIPIVPVLLVLAWIPNYSLRLHHYILALIGIPVLSLPNRVSLFCQAFLLGLFLDGVGRWGWDSILQYSASLVGDAVTGTGTPIFDKNTSSVMSDTIGWWPLAEMFDGYQGVMVIVDDILQARNVDGGGFNFGNMSLSTGIDHFFRLAYAVNGTTQDYTNPITLYANGSWAE